MSDCHRGTGDRADAFADNRNICCAALRDYQRRRFTYIELGDGDELWENKRFSDIVSAYRDVFCLLSRFDADHRLRLLYGNHDIVKREPNYFRRHFNAFYSKNGKQLPLFSNLEPLEGLILRYGATENRIFLLHGHQADLMSGPLWRLSRFLVRYLWKPLESLGVNDPTSTSKNKKRKNRVEKQLIQWAAREKLMVISGHTHHPVFPEPGMPLYFNDGSCVQRRTVTAIEIVYGDILLVRWGYETREDGTLFVAREILAGPRKLREYFDQADLQSAPTGPIGYCEQLRC
jgi:UDP-2,3-diacylglucosamine pyrophosphatase LpxH